MSIEQKVLQRLAALALEAPTLARSNQHGQVTSEQQRQQCAAWIASAHNLVHLLCTNQTDPYRTHVERVVAEGINLTANAQVGEIAAILLALAKDAEAGLLSSIANRARAEIFDDFLDHAAAYAKERRKNESGVIAGVVFEDSIRRVCRKHNHPERGIQLDQLISDLVRLSVLSDTKAKRARAAAHVRTKATHAQWDEYDLPDVESCISFTRELVANELDK